jgi:hypothetical protein
VLGVLLASEFVRLRREVADAAATTNQAAYHGIEAAETSEVRSFERRVHVEIQPTLNSSYRDAFVEHSVRIASATERPPQSKYGLNRLYQLLRTR